MDSVFLRTAWLLAALGSVSPVSFAQQTPPAPQPESTITFQTGAQEVSLDLVVRDNKGRIVKNVNSSDIQILENGVKQDVLDFRFISGRDVTTPGAPIPSTAGSTIPSPETSRHSINDVNVVCLVFHGLDPYTKKNANDFAREFVQNNLPPNTWVGLFSLDDNLTPLHEFTNDKAEMLAAIKSARPGSPQDFLGMASRILSASPNIVTITVAVGGPTTAATSTMNITGGEVSLQAINGADISTGNGANRVRGDQTSARRQFTNVAAHRNFDSMNLLISQLATLPGHKSVLLLSTGMVGLDDPDRMEKMLKKSNEAGITFYAVDVTGLDQNSGTLSSNNALNYAASISSSQTSTSTNAAQNMEKMRQGDYINQGVRQSNTQAVLRQISEDTGGFLIANTNDLRKPFQNIIGDLKAHYEAVYRPADTKLDGSLRTLQVRLNHPGWTVESRTGYYAMPSLSGQQSLAQADLLGLAALSVKPEPHAFEFDSAALHFRPTASGTQQAIAFQLPVHRLGVTSINGGQNYRVHASVLILIKAANGEVVDKFSQDSPFEFPAASLKQAAFSNLEFTHPLNLAAGKYLAEVAVVDLEARRASVSQFLFDNEQPKQLGLSSVTLVQRVQPVSKADPSDPFLLSSGSEYKRIVPELGNAIAKDAKPMAFFVVYPNKNNPEKPRIQVEIVVNGKALAKQVSQLGPPSSDGSIPMLVGAPLTAGDCELKITALQGADSATQMLHYSITP